jgi:hypothetical protein
LLACSATEQLFRGVSLAVGVGSAVAVSVGVSEAIGVADCPSDETANPPMIRARTRRPEPDPIKTSLRYGNLSANLANLAKLLNTRYRFAA